MSEEGYDLTIGEREGKGYTIPGERNLLFRIYTEEYPKTVLIDGIKVKKYDGSSWTVSKKTGECLLSIPDDGKKHEIKLIF